MPIELGLASSHAPGVVAPLEMWETLYERFAGGVPQPPEAGAETPEVISSYISRIERAFAVLRQQLAEYRPELLIVIGGDQSEMFDRSNVPNLMIYVGSEATATWIEPGASPDSEQHHLGLTVDADTSRALLNRLVKEEDFDVAFSTEERPLGPRGRGLPHAFFRPLPLLVPAGDIPVVLIYENTYDPPSLSAQRCYQLGQVLERLLRDDPRRIAIYGSGGLSHDPGGPRSGWIDEPLDQWFLEQLRKGEGQKTTAMYSFDSMTMRGGTGEMRAWITVAGAMEQTGRKANVLDYIPAHKTVTGLGWAVWPQNGV